VSEVLFPAVNQLLAILAIFASDGRNSDIYVGEAHMRDFATSQLSKQSVAVKRVRCLLDDPNMQAYRTVRTLQFSRPMPFNM